MINLDRSTHAIVTFTTLQGGPFRCQFAEFFVLVFYRKSMEPTWIVKCVENLLRVKSFELSEAFFILIASNAAFATRFWVTRKHHSLPTIKTDFIVNHAIMSKIFKRKYLV